jgi:hypothetical protein
MSIQYPKLIHATLPSVDAYNGNNEITRDPHKSIFTTKKYKINDHSEITEDIDGSGDRICEVIKKYPRGINQFVTVDYSNNGTNGGQNRQTSGGTSGSVEAYLPYRVMRDGAFRPPVRGPKELLPLSRQARLWTPITSTPGYIKQNIECAASNNKAPRRQIVQTPIQTQTRPVLSKRLDTPLDSTASQSYIIQNAVNTCASRPSIVYDLGKSGAIPDLNSGNYINNNNVYKSVSSNVSSLMATNDCNGFTPVDKSIRPDNQWTCLNTNVSNQQVTPSGIIATDFLRVNQPFQTSIITNVSSDFKKNIQSDYELVLPETLQGTAQSNISSMYTKSLKHEKDIVLERPQLYGNMNTNACSKEMYVDNSAKNIKILPKINYVGGFDNTGTLQRMEPIHGITDSNYKLNNKRMNR